RLAGDLESLSAAFWVVMCLGAGVRLVTAVDSGEGDYVDYQHLTTAAFSLTLEQVQEAFEVAKAEYDRSAPYPTISTDVRYSPAVRHQRNRPAHPDARQLDQAQRSFEGALKLLMR
ncbi:hypothetical protein HPB47_023518, partial [Ixodes persulcatus]